MYNGIGLQTARGSGTNGYVQTNKFFVRPRNGGKPVSGGKGFADDQGTAGLSKKPNKAILEHDRKRQIHLKLAVLEDELSDQGFSDAEIAEKLEEARLKFEAAAASEESDAAGDSKISDTQTHQVAARKEKQMEAFRAALGLRDQEQAEEGIIEEEPTGVVKERREHSFLDRGSGRKKVDEGVEVKDGKVKESKKQRGGDDVEEVKRHKKKESKKRRHGDDSSESDDKGRDRRRRSKKKAKGRKQESDSESDSSSSDSDSDSDSGEKRRRKATKKRGRSRRSVSSESESDAESDDSKKLRKSHKKSRPTSQSGSKEVRDKPVEPRKGGRKRHDSDVSEPESEDEKPQLRKKEEAYREGGQKQKRDEKDVESSPLKDTYRGGSSGKKAARDSDSDDSETEYGNNKKQLRSKVEVYSGGMSKKRDEEEIVSKHDKDSYRSGSRSKQVARDSSDDSEAEYENRRMLKDDTYQRGRKQIREEDHSHLGRDRYRSDDAGQRRGAVKDVDDRYRGRASDEEDDNDRDRYRQRRETVRKDDEEYKRGRDRYRGDKEDRYRDDVAAGKRHVTGKEDEDDERVSREREYSNKGRSHYDGRSSGKRSSYGDRD
ncbi:hypothetical protein Bca52824_000690 [Brassica carinata]|uniref:CWF21 domain-containing protein n=1 Tax=Brassica carinata TaxID=52824 RepID=A0A8X7WHX9_BRACI|nr:hypothetical protein Bca52824_000690 [Brassica carinata]